MASIYFNLNNMSIQDLEGKSENVLISSIPSEGTFILGKTFYKSLPTLAAWVDVVKYEVEHDLKSSRLSIVSEKLTNPIHIYVGSWEKDTIPKAKKEDCDVVIVAGRCSKAALDVLNEEEFTFCTELKGEVYDVIAVKFFKKIIQPITINFADKESISLNKSLYSECNIS